MSNRLLATPRFAVGNQAPIWPFQRNEQGWQAQGLEAWWPMAPARGPTLYDLSGKKRHATLTGGYAWDAADIGKLAPHLNGSTGYASSPAAPFGFTSWSEITVVAWVRNDIGAGAGTDDIASWWHYSGGSGTRSWVLTHHNNNQYFWEINGKTAISGGTVSTNRTLVVATYSAATGFMRLYVNGVQVASQGGLSGNLPSSTGPVYIGTQHDLSNLFDGLVEEVRIYRRALGAAEVRALFDPYTRWDLYEELAVPRVWPATAGGATTKTAADSLDAAIQAALGAATGADAALRRSVDIASAIDSALARVQAQQAALTAAVRRARTDNAQLDAAVQRLAVALAQLDAALRIGRTAALGLDANLQDEGVGTLLASLDAAAQGLAVAAASVDAALSREGAVGAQVDARLVLLGARIAQLGAVLQRMLILPLTLEAALRGTPNVAANFDAVIGAVTVAGRSRTFVIPARGGHSVAGDIRTLVIPGGSRRH